MCVTRSSGRAESRTPRMPSALRLIVNARIATGDERRPWADAILLDGARVVSIGASAALRKEAPEAEVVDARGAEVARDGAPFRDS